MDEIYNTKNINDSILVLINMEESSGSHIRIEPQINRKVHVRASEIIKKFRTLHDRQAFCKENSKS